MVAIADELGVEPASVAIAWVASRPGVVAPIASASSAEQVPVLMAATEVKLSRTQLNRLKKVSAPFT